MRSLFSTKTKDFITAVDEKNIILVREVKPGETYEDLEKTANTILDMLNTEPEGEVVDHTIAKSVIRTTERMTYEDCNALLAHSDPALAERLAVELSKAKNCLAVWVMHK